MTGQEMLEAEHTQMVKQLEKDPAEVIKTLNPKMMSLIHMAMGVSGEAGELLDAIKKYAIYNKELDIDNVIEELGDLEFYMEGLRRRLGISRELTLHRNINKLLTGDNARYKTGSYSNEQAQDRRDKE